MGSPRRMLLGVLTSVAVLALAWNASVAESVVTVAMTAGDIQIGRN